MVKALPFIHQPDREARKASDVSKNIVFFHVYYYSFSQGWKSLSYTVVYMINNFKQWREFRITRSVDANKFATKG